MSHGNLVPAPGTEFAVDSNKTFGSRARDYTNVVGTALAPFVGAIPVVGAPLKDAIGGLLGILTIVDVSTKCLRWHPTHDGTQKISQNEQALKALTTKLRWLLNKITTLPEASSSGMLEAQHDMILYFIGTFIWSNLTNVVSRQLTHTSNELEKLKSLRKVRHTAVSQILSQCTQDIMFYLTTYSVRGAMSYNTYTRCSQSIFTGSNTHGYEFDEPKGDDLCISRSKAHRCDWTPIFYLR